MADLNAMPRRISMAYILGFSSKPFKDPKPPAQPGNMSLLKTPGGLTEWAASDGRKGALTGPGKARATEAKSKKASSERGDKKKTNAARKETSQEKSDNEDAEEGDNEHNFTKKEDRQLLEWKTANPSGQWKIIAEELARPVFQCKARFGEVKKQQAGQNDEKTQGDGGVGGNQKQGQQLSKKEKKQLAKQNKGQGQNQHGNNKGNKKEEAGGNDTTDFWGATNGGAVDPAPDDNLFGGDMFGGDNGFGDDKGKDADATAWGDNNGAGPGGWTGGTGADNTAWDTGGAAGGKNNPAPELNNGWGNEAASGDRNAAPAPNAWGTPYENAPGDTWAEDQQKPPSNSGAAQAWGDTGAGGDIGTGNGGGGDTWGGGGDWTQGPAKSASNHGSKAHSYRAASHKSSHRHSTHHEHNHHTTTVGRVEIEVKPDETFSADELRLVARILQQDYQMVWNRVSWRFRDKTGRTLPPEMFEKKITGHVAGKVKERERRRKR